MTAARWATATAVVRFLLTFAVQVYFARLLGPDAYGLYATASLIFLLTGHVVDLGLPFVLLRLQPPPDVLRTAVTWQCLFGTTVGVAVALASQQIASGLGDSRAGPMVAVFSIAVILSGPTAIAQNLLVRSLRAREVAFASLASYFTGVCVVGGALSLFSYGAWALVIGTVVAAAVQLVVSVWLVRPVSLRPRLWGQDATRLFRSGLLAMSTGIVALLAGNLDRLLVSRMLGSTSYAHYSAAVNLANVPVNTLLGALSPILMAVGSRVVDRARLGDAYLRLLTIIAVLLSPMYAVGAVVAPALAIALFGEEWSTAGQILRLLLVGVPFQIAFAVSTPVLWNSSRGHFEVGLHTASALATAVLLIAAMPYGLLAVASALTTLNVVRSSVAVYFAARGTGLQCDKIVACVARGGVVAAVAVGASLIFRLESVPWAVGQLILPLAGGATATLVLWLLVPSLVGHGTWETIVSAMPQSLRGVILSRLAPRPRDDRGSNKF